MIILVVTIMGRYRRNLRPVNSIKHIVDLSATVAAGAQVNNVLMDAVQTPVLTTPVQVAIGARVSSIYLSVEAAVTVRIADAIPNIYMIIFKNNADNQTIPTASAVGASDTKRFVLHQEMTMLTNIDGGAARTLFRGVIKIPRGMQRQGNDDTLRCSIVCPSLVTAVCIQCIFKEYR